MLPVADRVAVWGAARVEVAALPLSVEESVDENLEGFKCDTNCESNVVRSRRIHLFIMIF